MVASAAEPKRFAVLLSGAPDSARSRAGLDAALAAAALGQAVALILLDDALLHLAPKVGSQASGVDFGALRHYGIAPIHGSATALEALGPLAGRLRDDLEIAWLDDAAIGELLAGSEVLLSF